MDVDQSQVLDEEEEAKKREEKERIKLEKRQVRQGYRSLIATTEGMKEETVIVMFLAPNSQSVAPET